MYKKTEDQLVGDILASSSKRFENSGNYPRGYPTYPDPRMVAGPSYFPPQYPYPPQAYPFQHPFPQQFPQQYGMPMQIIYAGQPMFYGPPSFAHPGYFPPTFAPNPEPTNESIPSTLVSEESPIIAHVSEASLPSAEPSLSSPPATKSESINALKSLLKVTAKSEAGISKVDSSPAQLSVPQAATIVKKTKPERKSRPTEAKVVAAVMAPVSSNQPYKDALSSAKPIKPTPKASSRASDSSKVLPSTESPPSASDSKFAASKFISSPDPNFIPLPDFEDNYFNPSLVQNDGGSPKAFSGPSSKAKSRNRPNKDARAKAAAPASAAPEAGPHLTQVKAPSTPKAANPNTSASLEALRKVLHIGEAPGKVAL